MKQMLLSEIKFHLFQLKNRIVLFLLLSLLIFLLLVIALINGIMSLSSFFPAFLLLCGYLAFIAKDIVIYRKFLKMRSEYHQVEGADERISVFLHNGVKVKPAQGQDISVTDQFGNHLIIFQLEQKWLVETQFIDEDRPTYYCFEFYEYPSSTNWLSRGKDKKPKWHELINKITDINMKGAA